MMIIVVEVDFLRRPFLRFPTTSLFHQGYTPEEIDIRVDAVDRSNAMIADQSKYRADIVVKSAAHE